MQAFTRSILDLFPQGRRYMVPLFQRPYVWTEEKQWEPLWEDIRTKTEEFLNGQEMDPHFMGAIVINQMRTYGPSIPTHEIIDGQQRLTTFQLFLTAFRDIAAEIGPPHIAAELKNYILNLIPQGAAPEEEFKVWPTRADQEGFAHTAKAGGRSELEKLYPAVYKRKQLQPRPKMVEAYLFFERSIRDFIYEGTPSTHQERVQGLHFALQRSLQLVSIELDTKDDPQVIFETLNARGEPLLSSDLLRNFTFLRAKRESVNADLLYDKYWAPFDTQEAEEGANASHFWKVEELQGRLKRPRLDLFFQHFLALKTGRDVNVTRLYHDYRRWIEREKPFPGIEAELVELQRYSTVFAKFFVPDEGTEIGRFIVRLRKLLDTNTVFPLLLYLEADSGMSVEERTHVLRDLESYLVRRIVCGLTEKGYNILFLQMLRALRNHDALSPATFREILLGLEGESRLWPDDAQFRVAWLGRPIYRAVKSTSRVEAMLRAIEDHQISDRRETIRLIGTLTIEHVMPQEWEAHWPLPEGLDRLTAEPERDKLLHTFGNLTLLTQKLNSDVSNGPYHRKQPLIIRESALQMNTYFQDRQGWDEEAIRDRGASLFGVAQQLWPFPQGEVTQRRLLQGSMTELPTHPTSKDTGTQLNEKAGRIREVQLVYWGKFIEYLDQLESTLRPNKPYAQNWIYIPLARGGFKLEATIVRQGRMRVSCGLTIQQNPGAASTLKGLWEQRDIIEGKFGGPLDWESRNELSTIECHVQVHLEDEDFLKMERWAFQFEWLKQNLEALRAAFLLVLSE